MIKAIVKDWTNILSIVVSYLCYAIGDLSTVDAIDKAPIVFRWLNVGSYNSIVEHKGLCLFFLIIIFLVIIVRLKRKAYNDQRQWLRKFLKHLTNQHLAGGNYNTRITIFSEQRGWRFMLPYLFKFLCRDAPGSIVPNPFKKYLSIYVRYCSRDDSKSNTFFRINNDPQSESTSIVAECYKTGETKTCTTESIQDIKLPSDYGNLSRSDKKRVDKYMKESHISDYDTLLMIHSKSNSILAMPIRSEDKRWGVIVFDFTGENNVIDFKSRIGEDLLLNYQKIVQFTIQLIK